MTGGIGRRVWLARRMAALALRGRVRHHDRFGLSYWLWKNTRALATRGGEPRTDDTGVLEQLKRIYGVLGQSRRARVSVDVGAYIGVISLAMARFGGLGNTVHAFEADHLNYGRLLQNVSGDTGSRVLTHHSAAGNQVGSAAFTRNLDPGTNSLSAVADASVASAGEFTVPITTLDAFVAEHDIAEIAVLKIDVEGADFDVLRGAAGLLSSGKVGAVVVEIPLTPEHRAEMNALLSEHGLSIAYIVRNTPDLAPATEATYNESQRAPLNMLAVRLDLAERLGVGR